MHVGVGFRHNDLDLIVAGGEPLCDRPILRIGLD